MVRKFNEQIEMNTEDYYKKNNYPIMDKFDKKVPKFDYYDLIGFAESYHTAKLNLLTMPAECGSNRRETIKSIDIETSIEVSKLESILIKFKQ